MNKPRVVAIVLTVLAMSACGGTPTTPSVPPQAPAPPPVVTAPPPAVSPPPPIRDPARFNQNFWNQFVHNAYDLPIYPLQRLTSAPMLYLRTVDNAGVAIDPVTLSTVQAAMQDVALIWGGGLMGLAGIERGSGHRDGQRGWLTVHFLATNVSFCGQSDIGLDGGLIELNYQAGQGSACACLGSNVSPRVAKHELGHAFGYWHTSSTDDLMKSVVAACDGNPSANEIYHAQLAYRSPVGTTTVLRQRD